MHKSIFGNVLSPTHTSHERHYVHNRVDARNQDTYEETNHFHRDAPSLILNASNARVLTMTGNRNRGVIMNDPVFHRKSIFEQPVFVSLNQRQATESLLLTLLVGLLVVILLAVYYQRKKVRARCTWRQQQQQQQHSQDRDLDIDEHQASCALESIDNDADNARHDTDRRAIIDRSNALRHLSHSEPMLEKVAHRVNLSSTCHDVPHGRQTDSDDGDDVRRDGSASQIESLSHDGQQCCTYVLSSSPPQPPPPPPHASAPCSHFSTQNVSFADPPRHD